MKLFRIMFIMLFLVMSMGIVSAQDNLNDTMQQIFLQVMKSDPLRSWNMTYAMPTAPLKLQRTIETTIILRA